MKRTLHTLAILCLAGACKQEQGMKTLYQSEAYTVTTNGVTQGKYEAVAVSAHELSSTYQSPANATFSRHLEFKFSLNGKDNELPFGVNHHEILRPENGQVSLPVRTFGQADAEIPATPENDFLEANTKVTIRVDLSPVLEAFADQGYYEGPDGSQLAKEDFKGLFVAGNLEPLSWDFENLPGYAGAELTDPDQDGIYEVTMTLNVYDESHTTASQWTLQEDVSKYPSYQSGMPLLEAMYNLSLEEMLADVRPDGTFRAGEKWDGVWTRDISYSILLSLALVEPEITMASLRAKTDHGRVIQDTGTGGAWPISSDRMTWALAAWEVYLSTGNDEWLREAYDLLANSANHDLKTVFDEATGLFRGESSFLDWRKQSYPRWMGPIDIYNSLNLGTNAVHYQTYRILGSMARLLGEDDAQWDSVAVGIKEGINTHLWMEDRGYYGQYLYGREYLSLSERSESLGEALCVLFGIAEGDRAQQVMANTPVLTYGVPCIYPQIPGITSYHNNGIWPFVQAYYTWAAAETGNAEAVSHGMGGIFRAAALFLTNKENMVADTGDFEGTEINSSAQLWSVAGNLAMVYRILFGIRMDEQGLTFKPFVPEAYAGTHELKGIKYRGTTIHVTLKGWGNKVASVTGLEGDALTVPANHQGELHVTITLANEIEGTPAMNLVENHFSLPTPDMSTDSEKLMGGGAAGQQWVLVANGADFTTWPTMMGDRYIENSLKVRDAKGYWSFMSEPDDNTNKVARTLEAEQFAGAKSLRSGATGFTGRGFVELTKQQNLVLNVPITISQAGWYALSFRYSNGSGPINTNNQCALRSLYLGDELLGVVVMPQLGFEEWSTWGYSNSIQRYFEPGSYTMQLRFEDHNQNMNFLTNRAYIDHLRVVPLPNVAP